MDREAKERLAEQLGARVYGDDKSDVQLPLQKVLAAIDSLVYHRSGADHRFDSRADDRQRGEQNMARLIREAVVKIAEDQVK